METRTVIIEQTIATLHNKSKPCYIFNEIASLCMENWTLEEEALRLAKRFVGINRAEFARNFDFPGGAAMIYQHITVKRPISLQAAVIYARGLGCTLEEISPRLAVSARKARQTLAEYNVENIDQIPAPQNLFPEISWVKAGDFCESPDTLQPGDAEQWWPGPPTCSKSTFVLRVSGPSMAPEFLDGDMIFVDPEKAPKHNSDVVVRTPEGMTTFKRLQITPDGNYLMAVNPDFPERIIRVPEGTIICGVVACLTRMKN